MDGLDVKDYVLADIYTALNKEKARLDDEQKRLDQLSAKTLADGLPRLAEGRYTASRRSHVHANLPEVPQKIEKVWELDRNLTFNYGASSLWGKIKSRRVAELAWGPEATIAGFVELVLNDVAAALQPSHPDIGDMVFLAEANLTDGSLRPDLLIIFENHLPVGVVEVKTPISDKILDDDGVHRQLHLYMKALRSFYGLTRCLGIGSTYKQWRLFELGDNDELLYSKDVFDAADPQRTATLIRALGTALVHMIQAHRDRRHDLQEPMQPPCSALRLDHKSCSWSTVDWAFRFGDRLPAPWTETLFLYYPLSSGAQGKAWLATTARWHVLRG